jgi:hypothetical protein
LTWYYLVTIAIPLANGAAGDGSVFLQHAFVVVVVPLVVVATVCMLREIWRAVRLR